MPRRLELPDDAEAGRMFGALALCVGVYWAVMFANDVLRVRPRERAREAGRREVAAATTADARDALVRRHIDVGMPIATAAERLDMLGMTCTRWNEPREPVMVTCVAGADDGERYLQVQAFADAAGRVQARYWTLQRRGELQRTAAGYVGRDTVLETRFVGPR